VYIIYINHGYYFRSETMISDAVLLLVRM